MTIRGDSTEYDLLKKWCETLPFFEEPKSVTTCEIGVREGLGSQVIMMGLKKRIGNKPYEHIAIDLTVPPALFCQLDNSPCRYILYNIYQLSLIQFLKYHLQ